jgi:lysophospholipase L1-like esterase
MSRRTVLLLASALAMPAWAAQPALPLYDGKFADGVRIAVSNATPPGAGAALRLRWKDVWSSTLHTDSRQLDLRPYLEQGVLAFDLKVNELAKGGLYLKLECGPACERKVPYTLAGRAAEGKGWQQLAVPLSCFYRKGDDFSAITRPFTLDGNGSGDVEVANIRFLNQARPTMHCPDYRSVALTPAPQEESWSLDWWMPRHRDKLAEIARRRAVGEPTGLVFIGDSITHGWENDGKAIWERLYAPHNALNLGYGGDRTENVLWRLQHGEVDGIDPKVAVLMFGTNNTGHRLEEPALTVAGIARDIDELKKRLPRTRILLLAVFPREEKADGALRKINDEINRMLARLADGKQVFFLNINHAFLQPDGTLSKDIMPDLLHPNARGYQLWADAMQPELERLMRP